MRGYGLFFYVVEAVRGLRANSLVNLLAMGTIGMAMLIACFFLVLFLNLQAGVNALSERLEMSVYLKDGLSAQDRDFLATRLKADSAVKAVRYLGKDEALALLKTELKGQEALLEGLGENPLPDSFELTIDPRQAGVAALDRLGARIGKYYGVEDVGYGKQGAVVMERLLGLVSYGGTALALLLGVSVVFIVSNSVRLALYSRGPEIELMQWIGATRWFIAGPFLAEGAIIASAGTALAVGVLAGLFQAVPREAAAVFTGPGGPVFLTPGAMLSLVAGGGALGVLGGLISVQKFLE